MSIVGTTHLWQPQLSGSYCDDDPIGSFSQDPIGFAAGDANLYRYVGNGPVDSTDPSGLEEPAQPGRGANVAEWEEYHRQRNNRRFLEKSLEAQRLREKGDWGYRIAELPLLDLFDPMYLLELAWQDAVDWRSGQSTSFALRPPQDNMCIAVDPLGGMLSVKGVPSLKGLPRYKDKIDDLVAASKPSQKHLANLPIAPAKSVSRISQLEQAAAAHNYRITNYRSHGQPVFTNGKNFITPDIDGHNVAGGWKMARTVDDLRCKATRMGTYGPDLKRIGD